MSELMIALLGFGGVINGLEKLSALSIRTDAPRVMGLTLSAIFQTAGSAMAMICTQTGDYRLPMTFVLAGIVAWAVADKRATQRSTQKGIANGR